MYTNQEAAEALKKFIQDNMPTQYLRGGKDTYLDDRTWEWFYNKYSCHCITLQYEVSFAVGCDLRIYFNEPPQLSWGGTSRVVTDALACCMLYRMVAEFAAAVESKRLEEIGNVNEK
jgi:hypothetical protein